MNIEELEKLRKKAKYSLILPGMIGVTLGVTIFYCNQHIYFGLASIFIGLILTLLLSKKPSEKYKLAFKEVYVLKALKTIFTRLRYEPLNGIPKNVIYNTGMIKMGHRYSSNDLVIAMYKNIKIIQADVHIEERRERRNSKGNRETYWVTLFKGKWMIFDFNKNFKANIQVKQKGFNNSKITNWWNEEKFKKVEMEDQEFNKNFTIYTQNEHDAFYVLTPSLMEKIKNLTKSMNGKMMFCFIDNKLHVGFSNGIDSFEPNIFKEIDEEKIIESLTKDIKVVTSFVDELDLDKDLFRREV